MPGRTPPISEDGESDQLLDQSLSFLVTNHPSLLPSSRLDTVARRLPSGREHLVSLTTVVQTLSLQPGAFRDINTRNRSTVMMFWAASGQKESHHPELNP